jgi:hypothetical protein
MLYEALAGKLPFVGSAHEILRQKRSCEAISLELCAIVVNPRAMIRIVVP